MYESIKAPCPEEEGCFPLEKVHNITVLTTGGTIDKSYDESDGFLKNSTSMIESAINKALRLPYTKVDVISVMSKDSLDMTGQDREVLVNSLLQQIPLGNPLIVIHGTDTMAESADYCFQQINSPSVPIIFTGAMGPLGLSGSDALQNITEALLAAKLLPVGIYICFHNQVFPVPGTRKNKQKGTFEIVHWHPIDMKGRNKKSSIAPSYL